MADVAKKIITGKLQPTEGRATIAVGGLKGARTSNPITLDPPIIRGQTTAGFDAKLDTRLDKVRYYSGDTSA